MAGLDFPTPGILQTRSETLVAEALKDWEKELLDSESKFVGGVVFSALKLCRPKEDSGAALELMLKARKEVSSAVTAGELTPLEKEPA